MSDTEELTKPEDPTEEMGPPAFDELPAWFQDEINEENSRLGVVKDTRESVSRTFRKNLLIFGACLNVAILWMTSQPTWGDYVLMATAGALCAWICLRIEASQPTGVLIAGLVNLPAFFIACSMKELTGLDAAGYFITCLFFLISGGLLSFTISSERSERLPF